MVTLGEWSTDGSCQHNHPVWEDPNLLINLGSSILDCDQILGGGDWVGDTLGIIHGELDTLCLPRQSEPQPASFAEP
jgi:hypothetical protein